MQHLKHDILEYGIWVGGYHLFQTANYWPEGTAFVSVIDPGVGTARIESGVDWEVEISKAKSRLRPPP